MHVRTRFGLKQLPYRGSARQARIFIRYVNFNLFNGFLHDLTFLFSVLMISIKSRNGTALATIRLYVCSRRENS